MVDIKKVGAIAASVVLVGGLGMVTGANLFPKTVVEEVPVEVLVEVPYSVEVPIEVPVEVPVEVFVDNENLKLVLETVYDRDGNVEFLVDDLDEDELDLIVDRIVFYNDVESLIESAVKAEWEELVHREIATDGQKLFRGEFARVRFDKDVDYSVLDFDYEDAVGTLGVEFRQDDQRYRAVFEVELEDGDVFDVNLLGEVEAI
jgi:hypothetical protein